MSTIIQRCKKINKQKPQLLQSWETRRGLSHPVTIAESTWKNSSLARTPPAENPWALCLLSHSQLPFPFKKRSGSFPCPWETCMWLIIADHDCTSLLIPNKLNFVGEMSGSLLFQGSGKLIELLCFLCGLKCRKAALQRKERKRGT